MDETDWQHVVEALIFSSDKPLPGRQISQILGISEKKVNGHIEILNQQLESHAFKIIQVAGGFQFVTRPDYYEWIRQLFKTRSRQRLSRAALESLAVIAYKQPVSRVEIEQIRGVNSDGVIGTLLERNLITIKGRANAVGRPLLYGVTDEFLRYFGLNDLSDLPKESEIEALLKEKEAFQEEEAFPSEPEQTAAAGQESLQEETDDSAE
ncbi:segregation and condensation protein B [bacterium BMS3Abin05]|nr:segregation and condensation protein B [bacterium BMS3Abin05]GBE26193.1 segregation and condensation protein B [bacterium BMS3Bbin03]HDZ12222.1 SMC-Scp complex subunit ScpB [Bacteroidota bacterium]